MRRSIGCSEWIRRRFPDQSFWLHQSAGRPNDRPGSKARTELPASSEEPRCRARGDVMLHCRPSIQTPARSTNQQDGRVVREVQLVVGQPPMPGWAGGLAKVGLGRLDCPTMRGRRLTFLYLAPVGLYANREGF